MRKYIFFLFAGIFLGSCITDTGKEIESLPPNWILVWSDEFENPGLPDHEKWSFETGGHGFGNQESQYYTDPGRNNARVENGMLVIEARNEAYKGNNYTSAKLKTRDKGDWCYGRIEVRAKLPTGIGIWPAIWMMPTDQEFGGWPESGEIDMMELVGFEPDTVHFSIHTQKYNHKNGSNKGSSTTLEHPVSQFYTYTLEWFPGRLIFYVDNKKYFTYSKMSEDPDVWPFCRRFHLILNVAVGGTWGGLKGIDNAIFPQRMYIEYVRVYENVNYPPPFSLDATAEGGGEIILSPDKHLFDEGAEVSIEARAREEFEFSGWSGSISGKENPLVVQLTRNISVTAHFNRTGELLINPDFNFSIKGWYLNLFKGAKAESRIENGVNCISISNPGPDTWSVQMNQGNLLLKQGFTYRLSFTASASKEKVIHAGIAKANEPYTPYTFLPFTMTKEMKFYTLTYTMQEPEDGNGRVFFDIGQQKGDVFIESVSCIELQKQ